MTEKSSLSYDILDVENGDTFSSRTIYQRGIAVLFCAIMSHYT